MPEEFINLISQTKYLTQICITIFSIFILANIWWAYYINKLKQFSNENRDYGVIFLIGAIVLWSIISIVKLYFRGSEQLNEISPLMALIKFLSVSNNTLFLFALLYFDHGIEWIKQPIKRRKSFIIISVFSVLVYFLIAVAMSLNSETTAKFISSTYSVITLIALMGVLFQSFSIRKLYGIAFVSLFVLTIVCLGQLIETFNYSFDEPFTYIDEVIYLSSYSLMISIFVALTFSWIIEKSTIVPYSEELFIDLREQKEAKKIVVKFAGDSNELQKVAKSEIAENKTEKVIRILLEWYSLQKDNTRINTAILLLSQYNAIQLKKNRGTISNEIEMAEKQKVKATVLEMIDKIKSTSHNIS